MARPILATKTLAKIDAMVEADQGASFRGWLQQIVPHIGDAYRTDEDGHRSHMGASMIGGECARAIWYNFHWVTKPKFPGRIIRLFNRGHLEEARFIAMLLMIGCEVYQQDKEGNQYRISHAEGHFGGSGDGVILNIPDLPPETVALGEFKTSGEKPFKEVVAKGVRDAKFEHYVQMNVYMGKMGLPAALYMVVNKNTDELYAEILYYDAEIAAQFLDRGEQLVWMDTPPKRINDSPGFFKCRFCDHRPVCHLKAKPDVNCRTCKHSQPVADKGWHCGHHQYKIPKDVQLTGCSQYTKSEVYE